MAAYANWNDAISRYFTSNVPSGSGIFLTLNDDTLGEIAANFLSGDLDSQDVAHDFIHAVRAQVVTHEEVTLETIKGDVGMDYPLSVAFLSLMVLAAHRMDNTEAEGINEKNYFKRLTQLLNLPQKHGPRPAGLPPGSEAPLWLNWNGWLQKHSWQPTARSGPEGPRKYLNYVLTQALVRDGDKSYLQARFRENVNAGSITKKMDEVQLAGWLQRTNVITRRYLREGFRSSDPRRAAAFYEAAYQVFQSTIWDGGSGVGTARRPRIINAGIIRSVSLSGQISYRMFVPQPINWIQKPLDIYPSGGKKNSLKVGRVGHFKPLETQQPFIPESLWFFLEGDPLLEAVVFPRRDFWILTPDPEDPTGAFATWEKFPNLLGQKFTMICSTEGQQLVQRELEKFKDAGLLDWDIGPQTVPGMPVQEYSGCMILSSAWDGVIPSDQCVGLYEALKPKQFATISLAGGIRAPNQNAWLVGHPPEVKIYGFESQFTLWLMDADEIRFCCVHDCQQPLQLDSNLEAGIYSLEAAWNDQVVATRSFRLIDWEEIESTEPQSESSLKIDASGRLLRVSGAIIDEIGCDQRGGQHV
jgi:hypothetical protein